jgi:hypothetical protein
VLKDPDGVTSVEVYRVPSASLKAPSPERTLVARFGDNLEVLGYDLPRVVAPGQPLRLAVYTRVLRPLADLGTWQFFGHVVDPVNQRNVASAYAEAGEVSWHTGDLVVAWLDLSVAPSTAPGLYSIQLGCFQPSDQSRLRIYDGAGRDVGDVLQLGPVRVASGEQPGSVPSDLPNRTELRLGPAVRLVGYSVASPARAGDFLHLTLYWRAIQPVEADYTVFVHLVDADGKPLAQRDAQPRDGKLPTGVWLPGEVVADDYSVAIPSQLSGRRLRVLVGMYRGATGERLPTTRPDGSALGDSIQLGEVEVQ